MDRLTTLQAFVEVVDRGSFSHAAVASGASQPAISKRIAELERHAGARLLSRSTRRVLPTDEGRVLYERARRLLDAAAEMFDGIGTRRGGRVSGRVRVAVGPSFSRVQVLSRVPRLLARHPGLQIELVDDQAPQGDTAGDATRFDLALRCRAAEAHSAFSSRPIARVHQLLLATPEYLQRRGTPHVPEDLLRHDCIINLSRAGKHHDGNHDASQWTLLSAQGQPITVRVDGRLRVANAELMHAAVLTGMGLALAPAWLFAGELRSGAAQAMLRGHMPPPQHIHAWVPASRAASERVHTVLQFLAGEFAIDPFLSGMGC